MKPMLSKRQEKILVTLYIKEDWVKGSELSELLAVSDRTIRMDIESIKAVFNEPVIQTSKQYGYRYNREVDFKSLNVENVLDARERLAVVIKEMILSPTGIDYFDLANALYVSESTLLTDLHLIRKEIQSHGFPLSLERHNDTFMFQGRRLDQVKLLIHWIKNNLGYSTPEQFARIFPKIDVPAISDMLLELLVEEKYFSRYLSFRSLLITVLMISEQAVTSNTSGDNEEDTESRQNPESGLVVWITCRLFEIFELSISPQDVELLNESLSMVKTMEEVEGFGRSGDVLSEPIFMAIRQVLNEVKTHYALDFTHETELAIDLTIHIKIAILRMEKGIFIKNPIIEQMKREYPFLFDVALYIGNRLSEIMGIRFHQDEISFIVCHLADTYESLQRGNIVRDRLKVLVVALEGRSVVKYIIKNNEVLRQESMIERIEIVSAAELEQFIQTQTMPDVILSTSMIKVGGKTPDLIIRPEVSMGDRFSIQAILTKEIEKLKKRNFNTLTRVFFAHDQFYPSIRVKKSEECIRYLCGRLKEGSFVDDAFEASVLERESLIPTSIQTGVALPHATIVHALKTSVAIATLQEAIEWGNQKVSVVLLFAIAKEDIHYLNYFYAIISRFAMDEANIQRLAKCATFDAVIALLYEFYLQNVQ
ncbi:MAG: hypothetical protein A2Y20_10345 [Firmicutes bacterium GWF2_51_9]|nr:MAG: hypothetical protein A2Y20_10345 [Firmicutes bacterium GWF2_51_9]